MFYIHPKDLDEQMPKIDSYTWHYYYGKNNIKEKFSDLLKSFNLCKFRSQNDVEITEFYSIGPKIYTNYIHVFNPLANFLRSNGISTENFIGFLVMG